VPHVPQAAIDIPPTFEYEHAEQLDGQAEINTGGIMNS